MPENKPISFKAKKPTTKTGASAAKVEHKAVEKTVEEPKSIQEQLDESIANIPNTTKVPAVETPAAEEDWEKKIAAAKSAEAAKQEEQTNEAVSVEEAAARIATGTVGNSASVTVEAKEPGSVKATAKQEPKDQKVEAEDKAEDKKDDEAFETYWDTEAGDKPVEGNLEYVATEEETKRAEAIKDKKEDNASRVMLCQLGSDSEFAHAFEVIQEYLGKYKNLTDEDIEANPEIKKYVQWMADLNAVAETSLNTDQQRLLLGMISALNKHNVFLEKLDRKLSLSKVNSDVKNDGQPKLLRGNAAMQMINNRYRGVYKIQLLNSGFWIKVTPLRNVDIDAWMQEVDFERKQIGRLIGGHFYLGMNIYLKEKLADLLKVCTVDSNLEKWNEGTTLVDSISIHDYDTLCWAFSTMFHKDGVMISTVCVNPDCQHHNTAQYIDIARCAYINPDVLTAEAMQWMIAGSAPGVVRTQKDIKEYKEKLLKNVRRIKFTDTDEYILKDPSLGEFIRIGVATLGKLAAHVKDGKLDNDSEEVRRYAVYHLTKMMSPWIAQIVLNDENGKTVAVIDDRDAITQSLETSIDNEHHLVKNIEEFMTTSKVAFYTATSLKCPKCGHQPNLLKDNMFPLDVEYVLFTLSYLKLEQIGVTL